VSKAKADGVVVFARTRKMLDYGKECMHALKKIHGVERLWLQDCGRLWILRIDQDVLVDVSDMGLVLGFKLFGCVHGRWGFWQDDGNSWGAGKNGEVVLGRLDVGTSVVGGWWRWGGLGYEGSCERLEWWNWLLKKMGVLLDNDWRYKKDLLAEQSQSSGECGLFV